MRTHMPGCTSIIAQTLEAQGNKKFFAALMLVYYAGLLGQSPTSFRITRLPPPDALGLGSFRRGSTAAVRLARLTGGLVSTACNQSMTRESCPDDLRGIIGSQLTAFELIPIAFTCWLRPRLLRRPAVPTVLDGKVCAHRRACLIESTNGLVFCPH